MGIKSIKFLAQEIDDKWVKWFSIFSSAKGFPSQSNNRMDGSRFLSV